MAKKTEAISLKETAPITSLAERVAVTGVQSASAEMFADLTIDQVVSLADGEAIRGIFRGEGDGVEIEDEKTGEIRDIKTWRIEVGSGQFAQIISGAQLDRRMPKVPIGATISVARLGVTRTRKGMQLTQYVIGVGGDVSGGVPERHAVQVGQHEDSVAVGSPDDPATAVDLKQATE